MLLSAKEVREWNACALSADGRWTPLRPLNHHCDRWWDRLRWAWGVLTGRYDALVWGADK